MPRDPLPLLLACAALVATFPFACRRAPPPEPEGPPQAWRDTWPVLVLIDPQLAEHLAPLEGYSATYLASPTRTGSEPWFDPWAVEERFAGEETSAHIGRARALGMASAAWSHLAELDAEGLCRLGRSAASFGPDVPVGYLFGAEGCLWAGDAEGARQAWSHWQQTRGDEALDWPAPPEGEAPGDPALRVLPLSGWVDRDSGPSASAPDAAYRTVYRSHGQDVEFSFLLPGDLVRTARHLEHLASQELAECEGCPTDLAGFLAGNGQGEICSHDPLAALPAMVGRSPLSLGQACGREPSAAPASFPRDGATIADLDGALEAYLGAYLRTIEAEAVDMLPIEAMPTVRELASRSLHRRVGLDAMAADDNATAMWALESAAGPAAAPRGANDPEMVCSLVLARFRAGHFRPAIQTLDDAGALAGWEGLRVLARTVARVEVLPAAESVGVMR